MILNLGKPGNKKKNENNQPHCLAYHSQTTIPRLGHLKTPILGYIFCPLFGLGNIDHNTYYDWF